MLGGRIEIEDVLEGISSSAKFIVNGGVPTAISTIKFIGFP